MANIEEVEGIGPSYAEKLTKAGVKTTDDLLMAGAKPSGRAHLEASTGIDHSLILEWVNHVDLMRIKGVGSEYSDLLEAAGVDSPAELAHRNAGEPRDHLPGSRRRPAGHRPSRAERDRDRGLDRPVEAARQGRRALSRGVTPCRASGSS